MLQICCCTPSAWLPATFSVIKSYLSEKWFNIPTANTSQLNLIIMCHPHHSWIIMTFNLLLLLDLMILMLEVDGDSETPGDMFPRWAPTTTTTTTTTACNTLSVFVLFPLNFCTQFRNHVVKYNCAFCNLLDHKLQNFNNFNNTNQWFVTFLQTLSQLS